MHAVEAITGAVTDSDACGHAAAQRALHTPGHRRTAMRHRDGRAAADAGGGRRGRHAAAPDGPGVDEVVDLDGALVTPAFVDAHVHATSTGLALTGLDLTGAPAWPTASTGSRRSPARRRGGVVLGHGWDETTWPERRPPTRQELDRASYGGVVYLTRIDVHSAVVSSALLAAAPGGARRRRVRRLRAPHHRGAPRRRRVARESVTPDQRRAAQRATRAAPPPRHRLLHELAGPDISSEDDLRALLAPRRRGARAAGPRLLGRAAAGVERARELGALGAAGDLFADGAIGSHTACLRTVYADADHTGHAYLTAARSRDHVVACTGPGSRPASTPSATARSTPSWRASARPPSRSGADGGPPGPAPDRARRDGRRRHDRRARRPWGRRIRAAGLRPALGRRAGMYAERLGAERARPLNPFAAMAAGGDALALGSDSPVTPLDPWGTRPGRRPPPDARTAASRRRRLRRAHGGRLAGRGRRRRRPLRSGRRRRSRSGPAPPVPCPRSRPTKACPPAVARWCAGPRSTTQSPPEGRATSPMIETASAG